MRKFTFFIAIGYLLLSLPAGAAEVSLQRMAKEEGLGSARLLFELSSLPAYRLQRSGQRVDLFFSGTVVDPSLLLLPGDETVVKVLLARHEKDLMVSFLLRRPPVRMMATSLRNPDRIAVDLFWDEGGARTAIAFRVAGLPGRSGDGVVGAPRHSSPYEGRWESFFSEYRTPLQIPLVLRYSLSRLPAGWARRTGSELARNLEGLAAAGRWDEVQSTLAGIIAKEPPSSEEGRWSEALWGESLMRLGQLDKANVVFADVAKDGLGPQLRARVLYLQAFSQAAGGDVYAARKLLHDSATAVFQGSELWPHALLLQAELALALGEFDKALSYLQENVGWPAELQTVRDLRLADALAGAGQLEPAVQLYRSLDFPGSPLFSHPVSLRQAAEVYSETGGFAQATLMYEQLAGAEDLSRDIRGLALLGAGLAADASGDPRRAHLLSQVWGDFLDAEAGIRARLKLTDKRVLAGGELERRRAAIDYSEVAQLAPLRELREEAAFKQALALYLGNEPMATVEVLGRFLREFSSGELAPEARVLMRIVLPPVIVKLVEQEQDLQALVLLEQYRELLLAGPMSWTFLLDVARASTRLGLLERAYKVYLYMLDVATGTAKEEEFYLPFLELAFDRDQYDLVGTYALRYLTRFPEGKDYNRIYYLNVRALQLAGRLDAAADLLRYSLRPKDEALESLAADIFWDLERYDEVARCFDDSGPEKQNPPQGMLLKAEALSRIGRGQEALPMLEPLLAHELFGDQATFRYAKIHLNQGQRELGLKIMQGLATEGKGSLWRKLAQETLAESRL